MILPEPPADGALVVFDGDCPFCHGVVEFLARHDRRWRLRFAAARDESGRASLARYGIDAATAARSVVLVEGGRAFLQSGAAWRIAAYLDAPWHLLSAVRVVPPLLRDAVYAYVSGRRRRLVQPVAACAAPSAAVRERLI